MLRRGIHWPFVVGALAFCTSAPGRTMHAFAQAESPEITRVTLGVSGGPTIFTDKFEKDPPAIIIEFLSRNVMTTLESVVSVESGIVREIMSTYYPARFGRRALKRLTLRLREPTRYTLTQRGERILIDIETPRSLAFGEAGPVGGMTILGIESRGAIIQRLNVMNAALQEAAQTPAPEPENPYPVVVTRPTPTPLSGAGHRNASTPIPPREAGRWWYGLLLGAGVTAVGMGGWRIRRRTALPEPNLPMVATGTPLAARGAPVLEQLVLRAMQQRHYEILGSKPIPGLPRLWIVKKGGQRQGVVCLSNGTLFKCGVIKQVAEAIQQEGLAGGSVVAMGAFSFPAKLIAKERQIRLIAREELLALIDSELRDAEPFQRATAPAQELTQARDDLTRACANIKALEEKRLSDRQFKQRAKAEIEALERETDTLREKWQEAGRFLDGERAHRQVLEQQSRKLSQQLAGARQRYAWVSKEAGQVRPQAAEIERATARHECWSGQARRQWHRRDLSNRTDTGILVNVVSSGGKTISGGARNISAGGLCVEFPDESAFFDDEFELQLFFAGRTSSMEAIGKCVWKMAGGRHGRQYVGLVFTAMNAGDQEMVEQFAEEKQDSVS